MAEVQEERRRRLVAARERADSQFLIASLLDPDNRALAARYLGELRAVSATIPLLRLLDAADPHIRAAAATSLGEIGSDEALPRLREIALNDPESFVRSWAIVAVGKAGSGTDVDTLLPLLSDHSIRVRGATALALADLGDPRAIEPLERARRRLAEHRGSGA